MSFRSASGQRNGIDGDGSDNENGELSTKYRRVSTGGEEMNESSDEESATDGENSADGDLTAVESDGDDSNGSGDSQKNRKSCNESINQENGEANSDSSNSTLSGMYDNEDQIMVDAADSAYVNGNHSNGNKSVESAKSDDSDDDSSSGGGSSSANSSASNEDGAEPADDDGTLFKRRRRRAVQREEEDEAAAAPQELQEAPHCNNVISDDDSDSESESNGSKSSSEHDDGRESVPAAVNNQAEPQQQVEQEQEQERQSTASESDDNDDDEDNDEDDGDDEEEDARSDSVESNKSVPPELPTAAAHAKDEDVHGSANQSSEENAKLRTPESVSDAVESDSDSQQSTEKPVEAGANALESCPKSLQFMADAPKAQSDGGESDDYDEDEHKLQIDDCGKLSSGSNSTPTSDSSVHVQPVEEKAQNSTNSDSDDDESNKRSSSGSGSEKDSDSTSGSYKSCSSHASEENPAVNSTAALQPVEPIIEQNVVDAESQKDEDSASDSSSSGSESGSKNKATPAQVSPLYNVGSSTLPLRQFQRIPVYIVEYHDQILEFIFKTIGSRHMPVSGNILVHFDSHPDMVISRDLLACDTYDKSAILNQTSIENWIMPLCFTGIINRIVWVKNPWCHQIPVGKHDFKIGSKDGKLYADNPLVYFLSEGNYCDAAHLKQARSIELFVIDAEAFDDELPLNSNEMSIDVPELYSFLNTAGKEEEQVPYILDIDLDFFSTANPFLKLYSTCQCYQSLAEIFAFENDDCCDPTATNERRVQKLDALKSIFAHLETYGNLDDYEPTAGITPLSKTDYRNVERFAEKVRHYYPDERIKWMLLYDAGCTADSGGLPHHISTDFELQQYYTRFRRFLKYLPYFPTIITISRSTEDEYCPPNQVEDIQVTVLDCLELQLGDQMHNDAIYAYLEEEYNIMEL